MFSINKKRKILVERIEITRKIPINPINKSEALFFRNVDLIFQKVYLFEYRNVCITPEGIVFKKLQLDGDLLIFPNHKKTYNFLYLLSTLIKRKCIVLPENETYLLCFDYWSNSIFHWMCDVLPRIEEVKEQAKECIFLLPKSFKYSYILETLNAYQFKSIFYIEDNTYLRCKSLISPEQIATSGKMRPESILKVRATLINYFQPHFSNKSFDHNLYISRSKARFRKVINEMELLETLKKYNFKVVFFEDLTVTEQVEICYHAKNIISIHGANLTNVIFMQPQGNVLELRKKDDLLNNYYYELTDSVNCNYHYLNCDFEDPNPGTNSFSLYVDLNNFETCLQRMMNHENEN